MENFIFYAVNIWKVLRLFEKKNCSSYFFKVSFFSAELVAVIFAWRVLCYAAILSWWMCEFDQSKRSYLLSWNVLHLHATVKTLRWDIFIIGIQVEQKSQIQQHSKLLMIVGISILKVAYQLLIHWK